MDGWRFESHKRISRGIASTMTIISNNLDDSRFIKDFRLDPSRRYIAKVHVKAVGIQVQHEIAANICLMGTWIHSEDRHLGSFETDLSVSFRPPPDGKATIGLRLGFWSNEAKGTVSFSDFSITFDDSWVSIGEDLIELDITLEEFTNIDYESAVKFTSTMSVVYRKMGDLYGKYPFDSARIFYESRPGIGCWAHSGNPIVWNSDCLKEYFDRLRFGINDACFGTIHEMGHNFDQTKLGRINPEMIANLALCYAVETLNLPIFFENRLTVGRGLQDTFYMSKYEATIKQHKYDHDGLLYCILRIKDSVGWQTFETVMRDLQQNPPITDQPLTILTDWFQRLEAFSGVEVSATFPGDEFGFVMSVIEF